MTREVERTDDGRFVLVEGRRWRTADPALPDDLRVRLLHYLAVARSGVRTAADEAAPTAARARVQLAKTGLSSAVPPGGTRTTRRGVPAGRPRCAPVRPDRD